MSDCIDPRRRRLIAGLALAIGPWPVRAAALEATPRQTRGPFYPIRIPLDHDNDLTRVRGRPGPAAGTLTEVAGRVLDPSGGPVAGARVEVWQCDASGRYHHPWDRREAPLDPNFQGYGRMDTVEDGGYRFRTIRPVPYPGRTPHIHFAVAAEGHESLVTQMYVAGEPGNARDFLYRSLEPAARERVTVALHPTSGTAELGGRFDIVLGPHAAP